MNALCCLIRHDKQDNDSEFVCFLCLGSFLSQSAGTTGSLSCAMTSQVSRTTSHPSCLVIGSPTRMALLLQTTTLLFSTPPSSICSFLTLNRVYAYIFSCSSYLVSQNLFCFSTLLFASSTSS